MTPQDAGVSLVHHFAGGLYAKQTHIPAGVKLTQHVHRYDHLSALMVGSCLVSVDGVQRECHAPAFLTISAGKAHEVTAITDVVWACIHATGHTSADEADESLVV